MNENAFTFILLNLMHYLAEHFECIAIKVFGFKRIHCIVHSVRHVH